MDSLTISSSMLIPSASNVEMTPAMLTVIWRVSHELDRRRISEFVKEAVWLEIASKELRNPDGKSDNGWLKVILERLTGLKLGGEYRGDPWGAVMVAEWEMKQGGSLTRLLIPPAAIRAVRAPKTFAKIEMAAAYSMKDPARRLYAALADKKHMGQKYWEYSLDELQGSVFDLKGKYSKWYDFSRYVLQPALDEVNDFGTVTVKAKPQKTGKAITGVRFDWEWKSLDAARVTDEENKRHTSARNKTSDASAPPLTDIGAKPDHQIAINLRNSLDSAQWESWFANCNFIEDEKGLTVLAPTDFIMSQITQKFEQQIRHAADDYGLKGKVFIEKRLSA